MPNARAFPWSVALHFEYVTPILFSGGLCTKATHWHGIQVCNMYNNLYIYIGIYRVEETSEYRLSITYR